MKFRSVFEALARFFEEQGVDYALIGAFALKALGHLRATRDVDFVVRQSDQARIVQFAESLGYETIHLSSGYSNHVHAQKGLGRIDFVYATGETAERIFQGVRKRLVLDDLNLNVADPGHLIALKVFAIRNDPSRTFRELADIRFLMSLPGIDSEEVKRVFEKYGQGRWYHELLREQERN